MANPIKYTLATNLVTYSEDFTNANWGKSNVSVTGDTTSSPIGTSTADSLIENSVVLTQHAITKSIISTAGNIYTYSIYLKSNSRSSSAVWMFDSSYTNGFGGNFNLTASTVTNLSQGTGVSSGVNQITNVGNGWYRCSITGKIPTVTSFNLAVYLLNNSGVSNYTGDGTSNMYIWGAQLELGSVATTYIATTASTVTVNATQSNSIKTSNFAIGVNKGGYGPTNITNFYNGKTANVGGYTVYVSNGSGSPSPFVASNDAALITLSNQLGGSGITTISAALNFFNASSTILCTNMDYPNIVTSGLVLNLDAAYTPSFPKNGTTWTDLSGNGNNGTLVNGPSYSSTVSGSIGFDGSNDYVDCGNNTTTTFAHNSPWSVQFIVKTNGFVNTYPGYIIKGSSVTSGILIFYISNGQLFWKHNNLGYLITTMTFGNTYDIAITYGGSGNVMVYVNGIFTANVGTMSSTDSINPLYLGRGDEYSKHSHYTLLKYNRALSSTEVLQNYYAGLQRFIPTDSLVLSFDGSNTDKQVATASTAYDMSGNNNNGTLNNGVALVSDGQRSFSFDGTNDYISLNSTLLSTLSDDNSLTVSMFVNINEVSLSTRGGLLCNQKYQSESDAGGFGFVIENGGLIGVSLTKNISGVQTSYEVLSSFSMNRQQFALYTFTYNSSTKTVITYKNGVQQSTSTNASYGWTKNTTSRSTFIGANGQGGWGAYYKMNIGQLQIYSRVLTATEVAAIYTTTKSRYGL